MSAPDRSWTIAPTFVWFSVLAMAALRLVDGDWDALADRLTHPREAQTPTGAGAGPTFQANAGTRATGTDDIAAPPVAAPIVPGSRDVGSLDDVCIDGTDTACKRWAMDGFYASLESAKAGTLGRALRVSWYGDSVVASDALPGSLRTRLQSELGDGGPGFVYAVPPHRFCGHTGITRTGGDNWLAYAISTVHTGDGFYGPGGSSAETRSGTTGFKLQGAGVTTAELYYLAQPSGGNAVLRGDGIELVRQSTEAKEKSAAWITATAAKPVKKIELEARGGKTRVFGVALENATGAVVDNFGIVNVNAKTFSTHNQAAYIKQLQRRNADLIIIMIGANEAQWLKVGEKSMRDYQAQYEKVLVPIRQARPDASCLVMSPTDEAEPKDSGYQSRPVIGAIADAQRKAAHAQGCAFYSSYHWMGGSGSAVKWFKKRLISSDMIHLTTAGAQKISGGLFDALMAGSKNAGN